MPNQHLLTCKSHYALCTSHFALCSFEIETLSKPSPKSPLEKFRGAKSSDRSDPDRAVFSQYQYCPNSWPIESTAVPSPSRDTKRRQAKFQQSIRIIQWFLVQKALFPKQVYFLAFSCVRKSLKKPIQVSSIRYKCI